MTPTSTLSRSGWGLPVVAVGLLGALGAGGWKLHTDLAQPSGALSSQSPLLLAPMIGVIEPCILPGTSAQQPTSLQEKCVQAEGSAAALVEATLKELAPSGIKPQENWELGYTLPVPLLQLFKEQEGEWQIDQPLVNKLARTVRDSERPAVLYLFATHFASHAPLELALVSDPSNLA